MPIIKENVLIEESIIDIIDDDDEVFSSLCPQAGGWSINNETSSGSSDSQCLNFISQIDFPKYTPDRLQARFTLPYSKKK